MFTELCLILILGTSGPPSIPRVTDSHKESVSLAWTRPVEDGGADVIGYVLEMQEAGAEEWTKVHEKNLRVTEHIVTGLSAGKKYYFRVAAVNVNGMGDFSDPCAETEPVERIGKFKQLLNACMVLKFDILYMQMQEKSNVQYSVSVFSNKFSNCFIIYSRNS